VTDLNNISCSPRHRYRRITPRAHLRADQTGRYGVVETEYQYAPLRIFDFKPGLDGTVKTSAAGWRLDTAMEQHAAQPPDPLAVCLRVGLRRRPPGLQHDGPTNPYTVATTTPAIARTRRARPARACPAAKNGTWGVDIRNADGLVVVRT